jgi:hypothetical protein
MIRLLRWFTRDHELPPRLCHACIARSIHHPAGPLHRRTTGRIRNWPICERHSYHEAIRLLSRC